MRKNMPARGLGSVPARQSDCSNRPFIFPWIEIIVAMLQIPSREIILFTA
jgi:hypothetical protein